MLERENRTAEDALEAKGIETNNDFVSIFCLIRNQWCDEDEEQEVLPMSKLERLSGVVRPPTTVPQTNADPAVDNDSNREGNKTGPNRENFSLEDLARLM